MYFCYWLWFAGKAVLAVAVHLLTDGVGRFLMTEELLQLHVHISVNGPFFRPLPQHSFVSFYIPAVLYIPKYDFPT